MNKEEQEYLDLVKECIQNGALSKNRTGIDTKSLFAKSLRFSIRDNVFPIITSRRTFIRGAFEEFSLFMRGETNTKQLSDKNVKIWEGNTTRDFLDKRGLLDTPEYDIGTLYSFQIRNWSGDYQKHLKGERTGVDQLDRVVNILKEDKTSRRAIISHYNVSQLDTGCLEPCHTMYVFNVNQEKGELNCHLTQRSGDAMAGIPLNIFYTSLLTRCIASIIGLNPGEICLSVVDFHVYSTHFEQALIQSEREPYPFPKLHINKEIKTIKDIEELKFEDLVIENYQFHEPIKYEMAI